MTFQTLARLASPLALFLFAAACGGKTTGGTGGTGGSGTGSGTGGSGGTGDSGTAVTVEADGGVCVNVDLADYDQSCTADSDCILIRAGEICDGQCVCGSTPINAAGENKYDSQISSLKLEECPCAFPGQPRCVQNECTPCDPSGGGFCGEGTTTTDSGVVESDGGTVVTAPDSGVEDSDGGSGDGGEDCVEIDLSSYDTSCNQAIDCTLIQTGNVCSGQCECGGEPVNVSGQTRYNQAVSSIMFSACPCSSPPPVQCVNQVCTLCEGQGGNACPATGG